MCFFCVVQSNLICLYIKQAVSVAKCVLSQDTHHPHTRFRANCRNFELEISKQTICVIVVVIRVVVVVHTKHLIW